MKEKLEEIYRLYPRRGNGKKAGMAKLERTIKTDEDLKNLRTAVLNYRKWLEDSGIYEPRFIKLWSTFSNNWEDFMELEEQESLKPDPFKLIRGGE